MYIERTNSTNSLLKELLAKGEWPDKEPFLRAGFQTAGRGQTGNGWESEAGKNLLCSILIDISHQPSAFSSFYLNVAVSVAVRRVIQSNLYQRSGLTSNSEAVSIKWPNDIYWGDKKLAGILIENAIIGSEIKYSIAGIGLNVNQTEFVSNAPNPISLKQITGKEYDIDALMKNLYDEVQRVLKEDVWAEYRAHLYRKEGFWPFVEREVSMAPTMNANSQELTAISHQPSAVSPFLARIEDILPTGEIVLRDQQGTLRTYHFKQVRYVL